MLKEAQLKKSIALRNSSWKEQGEGEEYEYQPKVNKEGGDSTSQH